MTKEFGKCPQKFWKQISKYFSINSNFYVRKHLKIPQILCVCLCVCLSVPRFDMESHPMCMVWYGPVWSNMVQYGLLGSPLEPYGPL